MAAYTPNYQLHQWVGSDQFRRTDFNEDFAKIDAALGQKAEKTALAALQTQVNGKADQSAVDQRFQAVTQTVAERCRMAFGSYTGNNAASRTISLPFSPKAVFVEAAAGLRQGDGRHRGGLALLGYPAKNGDNLYVTLTGFGFTVYYGSGGAGTNDSTWIYNYLALG